MKNDGKDVGYMDDIIYYLQNGIHATNHAIESYIMTKDDKWLDIAQRFRRNRSKKMYELLSNQKTKDERYCFIKHALACSQALKELGNRHMEDKEFDLAKECFEEAVMYESICKILFKGDKL